MFGFGKKKHAAPAGASEKIRVAQMMKQGLAHEDARAGGDGKGKKQDLTAPVVVIVGMGIALALLLTEGVLAKSGFRLSFLPPVANKILFGREVYSFIGDRDIDKGILILVRGLALCLAAGAVPFLARLWMRLRDLPQGNTYVAVWGMTVGVPFVFLFCRDFFFPLAKELFELFML